jgi:hypothetical protein
MLTRDTVYFLQSVIKEPVFICLFKVLRMQKSITRVTRSHEEARLFYNRISRIYDFSEGMFKKIYTYGFAEIICMRG